MENSLKKFWSKIMEKQHGKVNNDVKMIILRSVIDFTKDLTIFEEIKK
jgi:hypothetical protein